MMLILSLAGLVHWTKESTTAYVRHLPGQLIVTQRGVDNLLLSQASVPPTALDQLGRLKGVRQVIPIATIGAVLGTGGPSSRASSLATRLDQLVRGG
jgi:hypothetical protein